MNRGDRIIVTCTHGVRNFGFIAYATADIYIVELDGKDRARDGLVYSVMTLVRKTDGYHHLPSGQVMTVDPDITGQH